MNDRTPSATQSKVAHRPGEVAEILSVSKSHVYRLIRRGQLPVVTLGGRWMVLAEELDRFIERVKAGEAA